MTGLPSFDWQFLFLRITDRAYRSEAGDKLARSHQGSLSHSLEGVLGSCLSRISHLLHQMEDLQRRTRSEEAHHVIDYVSGKLREVLHQIEAERHDLAKLHHAQEEAERLSSNRRQWLEEIADDLVHLPEMRAIAYQQGSAQSVLYLLSRDPEAPWQRVIRDRLTAHHPGVALSLLLSPSRPRNGAAEMEQEWQEATEGTCRENPQRILTLLEQGGLSTYPGSVEWLWRESWESLLAQNPEEAVRALVRSKVQQKVQPSREDWGRALSLAARGDPSFAAEVLDRAPPGIPLSVESWRGIFLELAKPGGESSLCQLIERNPPPADARIHPEEVSALLSSERFSSEEKIRIMTLVRHVSGTLPQQELGS